MASLLNKRDGAASRVMALNSLSSAWHSGLDSQVVPICFQMNATASLFLQRYPELNRKILTFS
jgi:hypothetical protein